MNKIENLSEFANKRYGQNFLKNDAIIKQIIQSIPNDNLKVAEIGPGLERANFSSKCHSI